MSFDFKQFSVHDEHCAMKVGTDGVLIGAWTQLSDPTPRTALDLGAGSGIISLMIAQRCPGLRVTAVEIDPDAADDCEANFRNSPYSSLLTAHCSPAESFIPNEAPDLIISNPPFFTNGIHSPSHTRRQARHEGTFGPLAAIEIAARLLSERGSVALITPADCESQLLFHAELHRLHLRRLCRVSTVENRPTSRLLWQFSRSDGPQETSMLAIRTPSGSYTHSYTALTRDFYLHL